MKSPLTIFTFPQFYATRSFVYITIAKFSEPENINKSHGAYFFQFSLVKKKINFQLCMKHLMVFQQVFFCLFRFQLLALFFVLWSFRLVLLHFKRHFILVAFSLKNVSFCSMRSDRFFFGRFSRKKWRNWFLRALGRWDLKNLGSNYDCDVKGAFLKL